MGVARGQEDYPENVLKELSGRGLRLWAVDATKEAEDLGELRAANMVLVGALSPLVPVDLDVFQDVLRAKIKPRFIDVNLAAFSRGRERSHCELF